MKVDLTTGCIAHHEPCRQARRRCRVRDEAELPQGPHGPLQIVSVEGKIQILVCSGLLAEESIDSPTAVKPNLNPVLMQSVHHLQNV
jgi:hypothetical protein